jgi:hypothetical protein
MRKVLAALAVLLVSVVPAAVPAGASGMNQFLINQHPWDEYWGDPASDEQLMDIGYLICSYHRQGLTIEQMAPRLITYLPAPGTDQRRRFTERVNDAVRFICP